MDHLRSAHIRARFADPGGFDHLDPDGWLRQERASILPDIERWNWLVHETACDELFKGSEIEKLRLCCNPWVPPRLREKGGALGEHLHLLLTSLDPNRATVFQGFNPDPLIVHTNAHSNIAYRIEPMEKGFAFQPLEPSAVIDALFVTWMGGGSKAIRARQAIIEAGELGLHFLHTDYGYDFDASIAVSTDGKIAEDADYVVLFDRDPTGVRAQVYPGSTFKDDKLDLDPTYTPIEHQVPQKSFKLLWTPADGSRKTPVQEFIAVLSNFQATPQTLIFAHGDKKRVFLSHVQATGSTMFPPDGKPIP